MLTSAALSLRAYLEEKRILDDPVPWVVTPSPDRDTAVDAWHNFARADAHSIITGSRQSSFFSTVEAIFMVLTNEVYARPGMVRHRLFLANQNRYASQAELWGGPEIVDTFGYTLYEANVSAIAVSTSIDRFGLKLIHRRRGFVHLMQTSGL